MKIPIVRTVLAGALLTSVFSGCVVHEHGRGHVVVRGPVVGTPVVIRETVVIREPIGARVVVTHAPPAPPREIVIVRPGPAHVWIKGGWVWLENGWVWHKGRWELPPQPRAVWVPHRYESHGGSHVWIAGGWRF